jgi:3-deoxy-D-manno-octulosonic-acid transferase
VVAAILSFYIWLVARTTRWTVIGRDGCDRLVAQPGGFICITWHGRLFMSPSYQAPGKRRVAMISASRDGDLIARIVGRWGVGALRGSSYDHAKRRHKGGAQAYVAAARELSRNGAVVAITPDGPRGPRMLAQDGAAQLAVSQGVPVIAVAFSVRRGRILRARGGGLLRAPPTTRRQRFAGAGAVSPGAGGGSERGDQPGRRSVRAGAGVACRGCFGMTGSLALSLYLAASRIAGPVAGLWLARRAARGREDPVRLTERMGWAGAARPQGQLVWLHGASIGEGLSMLPLIAELRRQAPGVGCLVTTGTVSSGRQLADLLPEGCIHQFAPVDTSTAVRRFLDHWRPDLAIWVESEFWPGLMSTTARRGVPMMLVNARVSARSARRWARVPGMAAAMVRLFRYVVTQDAATAGRLVAMGADPARVRQGGNLKALTPVPGCDAAELERLRMAFAGRPVWLAASTHAPEEAAAAVAHRAAVGSLPGLLTILAPRHPERGGEIADLLAGQGLLVARRSRGETPEPLTEVWLADTLGEMGLWLRLAQATFVGGSIAPVGGHTPFEPAALDSAILHGPQTGNFAPAYAALDGAGGAREVADGAEMGAAIVALLGSEAPRRAMADAAKAVRKRQQPDLAALAREGLGMMEAGT